MITLSEFGKHHCSTHRSGWPFVREALSQISGHGFLDDFCEASHVYIGNGKVETRPWVGIIHHPSVIDSPLVGDMRNSVMRSLGCSRSFKASCSNGSLRGIIALSEELADYLRHWPVLNNVPVRSLLHPTDLNVQSWSMHAWVNAGYYLHQLGFFLRDTQAIYKCTVDKNFKLSRSSPDHIRWAKLRDKKLVRTNMRLPKVEQVPRLAPHDYDELMSTRVICTHLFGASANNVVVECLARATPLVVNPLPPVVQYLGKDYPLYSKSPERWHEVLSVENILDAHTYLLEHRANSPWLDSSVFARDVAKFMSAC